MSGMLVWEALVWSEASVKVEGAFPMQDAEPRLTELAHGGGCGCKLAPGVLAEILSGLSAAAVYPSLMVGTETSDDAAVWRLSDDQAVVATTDFFMPIVDDPFDFGAIAAANALSDVYAMGARPIFALAIVGMPVDRLSRGTIRRILEGGQATCAAAGVPVAGGHSIDSIEPIYGLAALGTVRPDRVLTNRGARAGDQLILTKALGVGVLSAGFKQGRLPARGYKALISSTTQLNELGAELGGLAGVHAVTDVTGFGLLGHALEMSRGAGLGVEIDVRAPAVLACAEELVRAGAKTGASARNWASYGGAIFGADDLEPWRLDLMTDPQTSGGLLIAASPDVAPQVERLALDLGYAGARVIGRVTEAPEGIRLYGSTRASA
jgi:selenide,water dikinase